MNLSLWFSFPCFQLNGLHVMHVCWASWLKSIPGFIYECVKILFRRFLNSVDPNISRSPEKASLKWNQRAMAARHNSVNWKLLICKFAVLLVYTPFLPTLSWFAWNGLGVLIVFSILIRTIWQYILINFIIADGYFTRYEWTCQFKLCRRRR